MAGLSADISTLNVNGLCSPIKGPTVHRLASDNKGNTPTIWLSGVCSLQVWGEALLPGGSARRPSAGSLLRALGRMAGARLFAGAPALPVGLSLGAGQARRGLGPAGIWTQPSLLLFWLSSLVFFLSLPEAKPRRKRKKLTVTHTRVPEWDLNSKRSYHITGGTWRFTFLRAVFSLSFIAHKMMELKRTL